MTGKRRRIGIDGTCWPNQRGFGRYTRELVGELLRVEREEGGHDLVLVVDRQTAASVDLPAGVELAVAATSEQPCQAASAEGSRRVSDLLRLTRAAARARLDVLYYPAVYSFFPAPPGCPAAVTVHDAIPEELPGLVFPDLRGRLAWGLKLRVALWQAARVFTPSESAARQVAGAFGLSRERLVVTGEGYGAQFRRLADATRAEAVRGRYGLPAGPLVLYVGGISPHKNLDGLLRGLARVSSGAHLAIVGDLAADGFLACHQELVALAGELRLGPRVTFTGFVPDEDLVALYNEASLLVMPSWSEGFGLPVLEAMACGTPVAVSERGSLPEVVGEAGLLFDPVEPGAIAAAIDRLLADPAERAERSRLGLAQAARFSWRSAAQRVRAALLAISR